MRVNEKIFVVLLLQMYATFQFQFNGASVGKSKTDSCVTNTKSLLASIHVTSSPTYGLDQWTAPGTSCGKIYRYANTIQNAAAKDAYHCPSGKDLQNGPNDEVPACCE